MHIFTLTTLLASLTVSSLATSGAVSAMPVAENIKPAYQNITATTWDKIEGNWMQVRGKVRQQWGKLTDDDITVLNGRRDELSGIIQKRYGISASEANSEIDRWMNSMD